MQKRLSADEYISGVLSGNRIILSRTITLIESQLPRDNETAQNVLEGILPYTGNSIRIGITGVPGVGKSTFIESFGKYLTSQGKKIAVLAIDPTSQRTKGSIMGDKTRMEELAHDSNAYIRPSPSGNTLGGVTNKTRETMLLCEAAGFDTIIVETVGVGQSETVVKGMVDFFLLLMLSGAGDELQGIKRGIMEMADAIAITKADGDNLQKSKNARMEYVHALHLFPPNQNQWYPPVLTCSALEKSGLGEIWKVILDYEKQMKNSGFWKSNRQEQSLSWMYAYIKQFLENHFFENESVKNNIEYISQQVLTEKILPIQAAKKLLELNK
ncbi:LAO/AO transport system ATPase [Emticicia oligotrophica DSM 17448]|uniref:LAO/AO transport system ATPase n=1 Tax=Emticicia oligotrophica (strain DSM 17448 / CIP 109782 / MTCC 6937 / GPTSA100-15) TaxID=929562 RepID=A0ABN4AR96_EMTOG|nr:methylmalonyl Co-A mutase-associated GTPase MeaB [Emticicia oligotrophica]AFK05029.1 LAO/AO transport system ATPase [Emticicia oligotrophica DSM 17448]